MISLETIRSNPNYIIVIGNHTGIIQSILDFDYLSGKTAPSIIAVVGRTQGMVKYFWGKQERWLPIVSDPAKLKLKLNGSYWFLNLLSGRRTLATTINLLISVPNLAGGCLFAENVTEQDAQALNKISRQYNLLLIGPSSVGLVVPPTLKLGAIGGITFDQIVGAQLFVSGKIAVVSASGGMVNELINLVSRSKNGLSFALSTGGDRFPLPELTQIFTLAQHDSQTEMIVYYGELGGVEEYQLIEMKRTNCLTKPVVVHIAGTVADLFPESPQFGHAKAKASQKLETALAKRAALKKAGFLVSERFTDLIKLIK